MSKFFEAIKDDVSYDGYPPKAWEMESFAIVACDGKGHGCVLYTGGPHVRHELEEVGRELGNIGLDDAPAGLSVWQGKLFTWQSGTPDTGYEWEAELRGAFRPLNEVEWYFVMKGRSPWNEADWGREAPDDACTPA